ncbi:hypothetical protein NPIL_26751 [Nephila pilipes]|uniref:Uncharacterized protein n=1 Tax=Nephila pilipes TaxID=299642 RepID=A0A8X6QWD4_NEPPI|nr:hypothetical protein NPIL_26751 [Nephila pilipes]
MRFAINSTNSVAINTPIGDSGSHGDYNENNIKLHKLESSRASLKEPLKESRKFYKIIAESVHEKVVDRIQKLQKKENLDHLKKESDTPIKPHHAQVAASFAHPSPLWDKIRDKNRKKLYLFIPILPRTAR